MSIRNTALGLAVVLGLSIWSWCRPTGPQARAQGPEVVLRESEAGVGTGGNWGEAMARYRNNQSRHWRQIAIGGAGPR